ncbi:hypothetical protein QOZ80_1BG0049190 [Eleusine coracana subsp. coracana]|nr:hypothetical protein QOZ80_1BG0049190 [Eleusine coracana subsp. coracana]
MQSLWRSSLRLKRRPGVFPIAFGTRPRWCLPAFAEQHPPLKPEAPALPDQLLDPLSGFPCGRWNIQNDIGLRYEKEQVHWDRIKVMDVAEISNDVQEIHDNNLIVADDIFPEDIFEGSSHRDGSIYKKKWKEWYGVDIADRNETVSEIRKLSRDLDCYPDQENCICHGPSEMIQIFSLSLAKAPISSGSVQLYGYMAARDGMDGKLNYLFNRSRDDPVIMQQGSPIEMTGPKRGIMMLSDLLFEFDMRIKTGEKEENDKEVIDGVVHYSDRMVPFFPITVRIGGNSGGAVDMSLSLVESGVEAIIEVDISEAWNTFNLSLSSIVCVAEVRKEVQIFSGSASEMGIKRSVVAVPWDTTMYLKFKMGQKGSDTDVVRYYSFGAKLHGCSNRLIKLDLACISVKVTWSPPWF